MKIRQHPWRTGCLALLASLVPSLSPAADGPPDPASRHELWVPTRHLEEVLKKHPNAVLLDAAQYQALIRDAGKVKPLDESKPPLGTVVEDVNVTVEMLPDKVAARVAYTFRLNNLQDGWCETEVPLPAQLEAADTLVWTMYMAGFKSMQLVDVASTKPLMVKPEKYSTKVLTQGMGRHQITLSYYVKSRQDKAWGELSLFAPQDMAASTVVSFKPAPGFVFSAGEADLEAGKPRVIANVETFGAPDEGLAGRKCFVFKWRSPLTAGSAVQASGQAHSVYRFDSDRIQGGTTLRVTVPEARTAGKFALTVPNGVQVLSAFVDEKKVPWTLEGGALVLEGALTPGVPAKVTVNFELPLAGTADVAVALPVVKPVDVEMNGGWKVALLRGPLANVRFDELVNAGEFVPMGADDLSCLPLAQTIERAALGNNATTESLRLLPGFLGLYAFDALPPNPVVHVSKAPDRFSTDADTVVTVSSHEAAIARSLTFYGEAGTTERATVTLPAGETLLSAAVSGEVPAEWKQVGQSLEVTWPQGLAAGKKSLLGVRSRKDVGPGAGAGTATENLTVAGPQVSGASRTSGYVALDFDESWKLNVTATTGLETRDVSLTPVKGRMVWYGLKDWEVKFDVTRREPVFDVALIAYALPRARQVEIEGQLSLLVTGAPLRKFDVKLTPETAARFRVASPLVAEQDLDEATGVWHLTLRKEVMGTANVRFRMSLPASGTSDLSLTTTLPDLQTPAARRRTSAWVVEANTDTEIEFKTKGVQPLDSLRPPAVEDYRPRHRVIAAFGHTGGEHEIKLTARRHAPATIAGAVALQAQMLSVIGPDGPARHEATYTIRHNGRQFLAVALPKGAVLLSTLVQDRPVKPVQAGPNQVRVPLPVLLSVTGFVDARVVYETPAPAWGAWGTLDMEPPVLLEGIPVLTSNWKVHAPTGYTLRHSGGGLTPAENATEFTHPSILSSILNLSKQILEPFKVTRYREGIPATSARVDFLPGGGEWSFEEESPKDREQRDIYMELGQRIILPSVQFNGASLGDALEFMRTKSREHDNLNTDPGSKGIPLREQTGSSPNTAKITLDLKDVPYIEALRYITELAGMKYKIEPDGIVVMPLQDVGTEQYVRRFSLPLRAYLRMRDRDSQTENASLPQGRVPMMDELKAQGIPFPEGATAAYDARSQAVLVRNTQPNIDQVEAFIEGLLAEDKDPDAAMVEEETMNDVDAYGGGPDASRYYSEKISRIILPRVQFEGASLEEALEFLRIKSRDFDTLERDPTRKGMNIILKAGSAPSTARISLDLKDVPLEEALRYVTELAGMKYKLEPYAVMVVPLSDLGAEMYTRTFKVPSNFMSLAMESADDTAPSAKDPFHKEGGPALKLKATSVDILKSQGIQYPEGASAVFVAGTSQLIIRNTEANLHQVEAFVEKLTKLSEERRRARLKKSGKAGLMPMVLQLPVAGQVLNFEGHQKATTLQIHYVSWDWQMARTSVLLLVGAFLFYFIGRLRPWMGTLLVVVLLTFAPQALFPTWLPSCNALLGGWLLAFVLYLLWRLLLWCTPAPEPRMTPVHGKEAAV
ncbi:MAG TPA: hypothetical protein VK956_08560 [Verrucomicrobium sp.]|nr:hypothetical protein [Verrucomicrobium sp.]